MRLVFNLGIFVVLLASFDHSIAEPRVVCYYTNWSVYRPGTAKFNPQNVNPYLCTHLIYAFGGFTKDNQLKPFDKYQDIEQGGYAKFTGLKTYNKELKTMLAIGGWNEGSQRFSALVASPDRRAQFVKNSIKFLRQNKFDGLDLDWEYPAARDGGKAKDRENYAKLVQELREEYDREHQKTGRPRLLLTMAVPAGFEYIDKGYDVPKLNKYLDWFNLLSYDYHSSYEPSVNHHAPLYPTEEENEYSFDNDLNINATIGYYLKNGADRDKLVLGIPTYGRSYTLFNAESNEIGAPADGPGDQGDATREKGYLAYYEICQSLKEEKDEWTVVQPNPDAIGPYAYKENQWVGYDDEEIVRKKSEFVIEQRLGGIMFWSIDNDDFRGLCNGKPYPLIEAAKETYLDGLENGVQKKSQSGSNKRKQQSQTTTRKPDAKKAGKTTTPPPPTTPSSGTDFKCEEEGFYPHPSDCKKYFWCLEAPGLGIVAHHFSCPSGLLFNKAADSCDYARNVYCTTKSVTTTSTTTSTEATTTEKVSYNKVSSIYKAPSRTTPRTTTVSVFDEIDTSDLEQEDPKVIKELIELIKKAGGIEELEKQINNQEQGDSANIKSNSKVTTPATIINKSLVDKIKNRATIFKSRTPIFNGAAQPEKIPEQKASTSTQASLQTESPKKYNSINRFSRPQPQSAGVDKIPESDAVLIEKPQYTSILRRKPAKPEVIVENDYNNDSDRNTSNEENSNVDNNKKYASISRPRGPVLEVVESDENDEDEEFEEEEIAIVTTTKAPSKYINLNRRRLTTAAAEIKVTTEASTRAPVTTTTTTAAPRRRNPTVTEKTVLNSKTNSDQTHDTLDITHLFKNIATDIEQETLIANKHIHDDDESNIIALPTESVTENVPFPESVTTITTQSPSSNTQSSSLNQVNDSESLNEIVDSATDSNNEYTTILNDLFVEASGDDNLSKQDESFVEKPNFIAPRPFSRTPFSTRNPPSSRNNSPTSSSTTQSTTRRRVRPSIVKTSTENYSSQEVVEEQPYSRRPTVSYRPGYRGTARFKFASTKSGAYDPKAFDAPSINQQLVDENRLRSLNLDRANKRPSTVRATQSTTLEPETRQTRRRPSITRKSTTTTEEPLEETTEYRIIEAKNRFNLKNNDERPDRLRFELTAGGKINFGFSSVKSRENSTPKTETTDSSKVKVITGPLDKSPIASGRNYKKGFVEEIPIQTSPETVTIKSFSQKLDLNDIPLNKSDIASFVPDKELRTDSPSIEDTTNVFKKFKLRPSVIGFRKRPADEEDLTTEQPADDETTTRATRLRPTQGRFVQKSRVETEIKNELSDEISSQRISNRNRIPQRGIGRERLETSSPRGFQSKQKVSEESEEVTQSKYLTRVKASDISNKRINAIEDSENSETQDVLEESTLRTRIKGFVFSHDLNEFVTESSLDDDDNEVDFTTIENIDEDTTLVPSTTRATPHRLTIRKRPKKIDFHATRQTITESANNKDINEDSSTPDDYEIDFESASSPRNVDVRTRPTRARFITRKRIITNDEVDQKIDAAIERPSTTPRTTTKKRVLVIRTKTGAIKSEVDLIPSTDEPSTEATTDDFPKIDDPDVTRRRLKVVRIKQTSERPTEESTYRSIVARTRVFKRPTSTPASSESEQSSTSPRSPSRFSTRRRIVKVNRKPVGGEEESEKAQEETVEKPETTTRRRIPSRVAVRNRNALTLRSSTVAISTTTVAPTRSTTSEKPKTTPRVVRRKLISRTPPLSRRTQEDVTTTSSTTTSTQSPALSSNESLDEDVASILPALTSVKPRKALIPHDSITKDISTIIPAFYETTTTSKPTTTFDQILQHQYKIKGLDKDYEDEKFERYENHQEEDEKLIGVLGSQVKVILHSVSAENSKIECLEFGNYPHPLSCKMYISCAKVKGFLEGYIFSCGEGMLFDPSSGVCDWNNKIGGCTRNNVKLLTS